MRAPDTLLNLAAELREMPARERRSVFKDLSPTERAKLTALLDCLTPDPTGRPPEAQNLLSLCLRERMLQTAEPGAGAPSGPWQMTAATRRLLLQAAGDPSRRAGVAASSAPDRRSLAEALAGLLSPRRWVR